MPKEVNVLIIGGAGYIGSHTTLAFKEAGHGTVVFDDFSTGHRDVCFGDHLVEGSLSDTTKLTKTLRKYKIDCVVHFAALTAARRSVFAPLPFFENNVAGTLSLLNAMNLADVKRIVFSSTAAVYGNNIMRPLLSEDQPRAPINPYGDSKVMVETILESCVEAYGMQATALRYFNASGADSQRRTGERRNPVTNLIPLIIEAARGKCSGIKIHGTNYETPDGTCIRDYVHVSDLASAHVAAVADLLNSKIACFRPINLGSGKGHSVREVISAVRTVSGCEFKILEAERRPGDPAALVADVRLAKSTLKWCATQSDLTTIVADAWAYAEAHL
jgi:UDP-glucose 4-epimerase